jgi:hypothetical protein
LCSREKLQAKVIDTTEFSSARREACHFQEIMKAIWRQKTAAVRWQHGGLFHRAMEPAKASL